MKDLFKLYDDCKSEAMMALVPFNPKATIEWYAAKSNWGRCWRGETLRPLIQISKRLSDDLISDKAVKETILHEMLHTCPDCQNHGEKFKKYAAILNNKYGYNIKRCDSAADKGITEPRLLGYDIEVTCTGCKHVYHYKHTSSFVKRQGIGYRCRCGCNEFTIQRLA